jgi:hypothetical protein
VSYRYSLARERATHLSFIPVDKLPALRPSPRGIISVWYSCHFPTTTQLAAFSFEKKGNFAVSEGISGEIMIASNTGYQKHYLRSHVL